ncbi:MAG: SprT-like domain-containing protein [Chitinophagaceae bacterium]
MSKQQAPLEALKQYLPNGSYEKVSGFLHIYHIHLTITRERTTLLGDYRNAIPGKNHRISVNGNLNQFAFLYTLLHEIAHLLTYDKYGHKVASHGREWKHFFSILLKDFLTEKIFPADIEQAIAQSLHNPAATSCAEDELLRVLRRYDHVSDGYCLVEEIVLGGVFSIRDGRLFKRGEKLRKIYKSI